MVELTPPVLIAVLEEMFGRALFWALVAVSVLTTVAFVVLVLRDRGIRGGLLVRSELWAPVGGMGAILFVQHVTDSSFADIGGPIDVIALIAIGVAGAVGLTMLAYVLGEIFGSR